MHVYSISCKKLSITDAVGFYQLKVKKVFDVWDNIIQI